MPAYVWAILVIVGFVTANTEIVNFEATADVFSIVKAPSWTTLRAHEEKTFQITPAIFGTDVEDAWSSTNWALHELFVLLDLESSAYSKFTLRISWPASYPTDFSIDILTSDDLLLARTPGVSFTQSTVFTRNRYARIRLVDDAVMTPSANPMSRKSLVPFNIIVEPLYLGFLPASIAPTVVFLLFIILATVLLVPTFFSWAESVAKDVRKKYKVD